MCNVRQSAVGFKSKGVTLEGVIASPQGLSGAFPGVVVCHPHPLFGGNMDNELVVAVCRALVEEGFAALRFNFRGVGGSEGSFTKGTDEREDVAAALRLLRQWPGVDRKRLGLAGYSFGASMVAAGLERYKAASAFTFISPPLTSLDRQEIGRNLRPKLFIVGDRDRLVPCSSLKQRVESLNGTVELYEVEGADHSWRGYEGAVAERVTQFFVDNLRR